MIRNPLAAGASRFAHFAGFSRGGVRADEGDEEENKSGKRGSRAEEDEEEGDDKPAGKRDSRAEEDDEDGDDKPTGKQGSRAEEDDEDGDDKPAGKRGSRAEEDDEEADDKPAGKRGSRAEEDDDDKDEMNGKSASAQARRRERARCAAIFAHPVAAGNPQLACSLAFDTTMTRKEAIAVMKGQDGRSEERPSGNRHARTDRASRNVDLSPDNGRLSSRQAAQSSWSASLKRLGVKQREG